MKGSNKIERDLKMDGFKTFKCVVCGQEVTKPKSFAVDGGRACRCHTEEIQASKESAASEKREFIAEIIEQALPQVMRKIERNMHSLINDSFARVTYMGSYDQKQHERDYDSTIAFHWHSAMDKLTAEGKKIDVKFPDVCFRSEAFQDRLKRETDRAKREILHDPAFAVVHSELMSEIGKTKENAEYALGKKYSMVNLETNGCGYPKKVAEVFPEEGGKYFYVGDDCAVRGTNYVGACKNDVQRKEQAEAAAKEIKRCLKEFNEN